jgi:hypothetical protein
MTVGPQRPVSARIRDRRQEPDQISETTSFGEPSQMTRESEPPAVPAEQPAREEVRDRGRVRQASLF